MTLAPKHIEFINLIAKGENLLAHYKNVLPKVGYYVYGLINPLTDELFYIGKGKNNRAYHHWNCIDNNYLKAKVISELKAVGLHYEIIVISEHIDESEAYKVESYLINKIGKQLTNLQGLRQLYKPAPRNYEYVMDGEIANTEITELSIKDAIERIGVYKRDGIKLTDSVYLHNNILVSTKLFNEKSRDISNLLN